MKEYEWITSSPSYKQLVFGCIPLNTIPLPPRVMDNIVTVIVGSTSLKAILGVLGKIYDLELQIEFEGLILPSWEATLRLNPAAGHVSIRKKLKPISTGATLKRVSRFPEPDSIGAQSVVASIAVAEAMKCSIYASVTDDFWIEGGGFMG